MRTGRPRSVFITEDKLRAEYLSGKPQHEIARRFGCTQTVISARLRELGITTRKSADYSRGQNKIVLSRGDLEHRYVVMQQSSKDIANVFGCSHRTVLNRLSEYRIPIRDSKAAHQTDVYLHKFNAAFLSRDDLVRLYCNEGKTFKEIAKELGYSSGNCIRRLALQYSIPVRTHSEIMRNPTRKAYQRILNQRPAYREAIRKAMIERYRNPDERERTREATKQAFVADPSIRVKQARATKLRMANPAIRKACTEKLVEYAKSEIHRAAQAKRATELWQDPEYRTNQIVKRKEGWRRDNFRAMRRMMLANCISPNKPETSVLTILNELYPNEWRFTGDGQVIIDGLNPDFINTNGKKLIIEVFGDYWHRQGVKPYRVNEGRVDVYAKYGYRTLIVWEKETKDVELLKQKIQEFVGC